MNLNLLFLRYYTLKKMILMIEYSIANKYSLKKLT